LSWRLQHFRWERLIPLLVLTALLMAWEVSARLGIVKPLLFPAPSRIGRTAIEMIQSGELLLHTRATLTRVILGVILGGIPALFLGLLMGQSRRLATAIDPIIAAIHPIPKIAIFPLIMVFLGVGEASKVFIAAFGAFFPILINTVAGVRQISPVLLQVAENYGTPRRKMFTRVVFPGSLPSILTGLLLALNLTLLLTVAIEIINGRLGLGSIIWFAWQTIHTEEIYVCLAILMLLGLLINACMRLLTRWITPWNEQTE
jgi:NitT/TauT family transport system permease protein